MTDEELQAIIDSGPPDPEFDAALPLLSIAELEMVLDDLLTRDQIISLAASRTHPAESHTT